MIPFHRAVLENPDFTDPDKLGVYTTWIEDAFTAELEASPHIAPAGGGRTTLTVDIDGKAVQLGIPAAMYNALFHGGGAGVAGPAASSEAGTDQVILAAPMNGSVVKWLAENGADVAEGDGVLVVEAMKMETTVKAHRAGTLTRGSVDPGDTVTRGQELARIL